MSQVDTVKSRRIGASVILVLFLLCVVHTSARAQSTSRISYGGKDVFLSGINMAWVNFAGDLGPNAPDLNQFRTEFQTVRNNGGNVLRLWLNTNGSNAPEYNSSGYVVGPGAVAIRNLKEILSVAQKYDVGLILCLWSFDMLGKHEGLDSALLYANQKMLTDTAYTMAYINNALIPMVDSVKGNPAIVAWEVCNEANGMTTGLSYYSQDPTVPTSAIERFTNLIAGAIHRTDPTALVTTGPGSFQTLTDVNAVAASKKGELKTVSSLSQQQLDQITAEFNSAHRLNLTTQQMSDYLKKIAVVGDTNIYRDDRLIAAGGDSLGTLDFYCVHYYYYGSSALSPFTHQSSYWGLTKPTVVAEFYMQATDGLTDANLYPTLYANGYAGALAWSWTDFPKTPNNPSNAASDTWATLQNMWNTYEADINVFSADWPNVAISSPTDGSVFPDSTHLTITAEVIDTGSTVTSVQFFMGDSSLGTVTTPSSTSMDTSYFSLEWSNIQMGSYVLSAIAANATGQEGISPTVGVQVGLPPMTKLEAETAQFTGSGITVKSDTKASGGKYLDIATYDTNATVTWKFVNHSAASEYPIVFGYEDPYNSDKTQFINVNGTRIGTLTFGMTSVWAEKAMTVPLVQDTNTVQVQMSWGYMYLDYLGVPTSVVTSIAGPTKIPLDFRLSQNYPNPFNPSTKIQFSIPSSELVNLIVYNVLGQKVAELVSRRMSAGNYVVTFDGGKYSSGVYFYRLIAGSHVMTNKMMLLK